MKTHCVYWFCLSSGSLTENPFPALLSTASWAAALCARPLPPRRAQTQRLQATRPVQWRNTNVCPYSHPKEIFYLWHCNLVVCKCVVAYTVQRIYPCCGAVSIKGEGEVGKREREKRRKEILLGRDLHIISLRTAKSLEKASPNTMFNCTVLISSPICFLSAPQKPDSCSRLPVLLRMAKTAQPTAQIRIQWENRKVLGAMRLGCNITISNPLNKTLFGILQRAINVLPDLSMGLAERSPLQLLKPCTSALQIRQLPLQDGLQHVCTWYLARIIQGKWKTLLIHCKQMGTVQSQANFPEAGSFPD